MTNLPLLALLGTIVLTIVTLFVFWPLLSAFVSGGKQNLLIWFAAFNKKSATMAAETMADAEEDMQHAAKRLKEIESDPNYVDPEIFMLQKVAEAQELRKRLKI